MLTRIVVAAGLVAVIVSGCSSTSSLPTTEPASPRAASASDNSAPSDGNPSYLFSISSEGGRIDGIGDDTGNEELILTLTNVNDHATQFADRPIRKAYVLSTTDLASRWNRWFADAAPNAVLTYQEPNDPMPHNIVLTIDSPVYKKDTGELMFSARHVHRELALSPDARESVAPVHRRAPEEFSAASLFIDSVQEPTADATMSLGTSPLWISTQEGDNYKCVKDQYGGRCTFWAPPWPDPVDVQRNRINITFKDGSVWSKVCGATLGFQETFNAGALAEVEVLLGALGGGGCFGGL